MATANVVFLPWVRQGAAAAIATPDSLGAAQAGAAQLTASLRINGANPPVSVPVRLRGPADVVGIDPNEIVRVDPKPGTTDFEPNYFVAIEFDRPDFPWLFTPAKALADGRLRPWLCLVVVKVQDGVTLTASADSALPVLEIAAPSKPVEELPDLVDCWAWVHGQVVAPAGADAKALGDALGGAPELSLSRLLCPRRLEPNTDYIACVVPTFEVGRKAGLGQNITETEITSPTAGLAPAWSFTPTPPTLATLPVYHHWSFRSGEGGDFESLVRLLSARPAPAGLGTRPIGIGRPGFKLPAGFPAGARVALEGALMPALADGTLPPPTWPTDTQVPFQTELAKIVNAPGQAQVINPSADPLLAPPLYGRWHAARTTVSRGSAVWLDTLNLDPRHRSAAAFGTQVVQEHQEALMAAAWEQAAALQEANQRLRQLQLTMVVAQSMLRRHFDRMGDEAVLQVGAPAYSRLRSTSPDPDSALTMVARMSGTAVPIKATSAPMRRIGRQRGPITRRIMAQGGVRSGITWIGKLNTVGIGFISNAWLDLVSFNVVRQRVDNPESLRIYSAVTDETVDGMFGRHTFTVAPEGQPVGVPPVVTLPRNFDTESARLFREAAREHLARIRPGRIGIIFGPPPPLGITAMRNELIAQIEPRRTVPMLARALVFAGPRTSAPTTTDAPGEVPVDTIQFAPRFGQPMYEPLRDLSQELLLPGLDRVKPNSVIGLQTNRRFVEAYLVGLNVEMGHEMLWRGFPTDQRGTCFGQFWDTSAAPTPRADIAPLHQWANRRLGDAAGAPVHEQFVMLLRSSLLRRYPTAVIYAAKAVMSDDGRVPSKLPQDEQMPAFRGSMQPDVSFFGFDLTVKQAVGSHGGGNGEGWFIVIQEQPGEPRFGLDEDTPPGSGTHVRVADGVPPGMPTNGLTWGRNAAHMAGIVRQQPVRIAIHASQLVKA